MTKAVRAVEVPHVPQPRAGRLRHAHAVAGIAAHGGGQHRLDLPVLPLHLRVALEPAARQHDAARCLNPFPLRHDAAHAVHQPQRARARANRNAAPPHALKHDFEQPRTGRRTAHLWKFFPRIEARHLIDIRKAEVSAPGNG